MASWRQAFRAYTASGGHAFYSLGNGANDIGVRDGGVYALNNYREVARLGLLAGSRAEFIRGPRFPVAVITFADGARYYSAEIPPKSARDAKREIAEYNRLAGFVPGPAGYVPAEPPREQQDPPGVVWSCRFCKTVNRDVPRCAHCGAPR
jgi:hypothetical protein